MLDSRYLMLDDRYDSLVSNYTKTTLVLSGMHFGVGAKSTRIDMQKEETHLIIEVKG